MKGYVFVVGRRREGIRVGIMTILMRRGRGRGKGGIGESFERRWKGKV